MMVKSEKLLESLGYMQLRQRRSTNVTYLNGSRGVRISFNRFSLDGKEWMVRFATWPSGSPASVNAEELGAAAQVLDELNRGLKHEQAT